MWCNSYIELKFEDESLCDEERIVCSNNKLGLT